MEDAASAPPRPKARKVYQDPRVEQTQRIVLQAARELLEERGYAGCTVEAITERSGVAKTTIYRHWTGRTEILCDTIKAYKDTLPMPNTGALRSDLIEYLTTRSHKLEETQFDVSLKALPVLIEAAKVDPSLVGVPAQQTAKLVETIRGILEDGRKRNEIAAGRDLDVLANIIVGGIIIQRTFLNRRLTDEYIVALVDSFLKGAGPA